MASAGSIFYVIQFIKQILNLALEMSNYLCDEN